MKNKALILLIFCITLLTIIFFSYDVIITYDSSHYLWLTNMLTENGSFANWDIARGIVFPLLIFITNTLLGYNPNALLICMYIFYLLMVYVCYLIYKEIMMNKKKSTNYNIIQIILFVVLILLNPIVFGYYHTLLTEFVATTISILMCYLSWKWIDNTFQKNKKKYIMFNIIFCFFTMISWNLKQPYVTITLLPLFVATIISIIKDRSKYNVISKLITNCICIIGLVFSIILWNKILVLNNVNFKDDRSSSSFFSKMIIEGISNYNREFDESEYQLEQIKKNEKISGNDKTKIYSVLNQSSNEYKNFIILKQTNLNSKDMYEILFLKEKDLSTGEAIKFTLKTLIEKPIFLLEGYVSNYLAIINIYKINFESGKIIVVKEFELANSSENKAIAYRTYNTGLKSTFSFPEEYEKYAKPYENEIRPVGIFNFYMQKTQKISNVVFQFSLLILPILLIISLVKFFKSSKKYNDEYIKILNLIIILYSYSFMHIVCHIILGSSIDRYAVPAYITTIIGMFLDFYLIKNKKNLKIKKIKEGKYEKV